MNAALLRLLQGAGTVAAAGLSAAPDLLPSELERANREELARLQKAQREGTLGFSDEQRDQLYGEQAASLEKQLATNEALMRQLGGVSATSGQAAKQGALLASEQAKASEAINREVNRMDIATQEAQKKEIAARQMADQEAKKARASAALAAPTALLDYLMGSSAVGATVFGTQNKEQDIEDMKAELISQGYSEEQALRIAQAYAANPKELTEAGQALFGYPKK